MKPEIRILVVAGFLSGVLWCDDALVDRRAFDLDQPLAVVTANFSAHARHMLWMRTLFAFSFIVAGSVVAFLVRRQVEDAERPVPICTSCKKMRDDSGYWNRVEIYISTHSEAVFNHSLCP